MASGERSPLARRPLLFDTRGYVDVKDPCVVRLGARWHLFGTGVHHGHRYDVLHATAPAPGGPWRLREPARLPSLAGSCVAAPGVVAEGRRLHMFVQTEYNVLGGVIEHLISDDQGASFVRQGTALASLATVGEAGVYDPHPAEIDGERYLVYSAFSMVGRPDVYLARSVGGDWAGPWQRLGRILEHTDVPGHNQHDDPAYEWGLEGAQLIELPGGRVLLNAVCFVGGAPAGHRQRVFFAVADRPWGRYEAGGPALEPVDGLGEIGHATVALHDDRLLLYVQERVGGGHWHYALADAPLDGAAALPAS